MTTPLYYDVLTYQYGASVGRSFSNPNNLPPDWPFMVVEQHTEVPLETNWIRFNTREEYDAYVETHRAAYDVIMDPVKLQDRRLAVAEQVKAYREYRMTLGVQCNGNWYHTDLKSITQHSGLKDKARDVLAAGGTMSTVLTEYLPEFGQTVNIGWKTLNPGPRVPMTCQLAFDLVEADGRHQLIHHAVCDQHVAVIMAHANPEAYNYKTGWPLAYGES